MKFEAIVTRTITITRTFKFSVPREIVPDVKDDIREYGADLEGGETLDDLAEIAIAKAKAAPTVTQGWTIDDDDGGDSVEIRILGKFK
jgi:hypothetical protein